MAEDTSAERSAMWAVTTLLVVVLLLAFVYFGGLLGSNGNKKKLIDGNIATPSVPNNK